MNIRITFKWLRYKIEDLFKTPCIVNRLEYYLFLQNQTHIILFVQENLECIVKKR